MDESPVYQNALEPSTTLGEYRLDSVLGVGGFGITYLAWDGNLEKNVAIKEYLPGDLAVRALDGSIVPVSTGHRTDYQWGLDRFIQEARTLARFSHPHIVRVNRYFESNGTGYMVMDYEEGESFNQLLKRAPMPPEAGLRRILLPLLDGLAAVHAAKFLHRDIKPANIFIRANGSPVLLDFGASRATGGGTRGMTAVLTPGYAPLEQYAAEGRQGPWSDIYALAGVLFRAVTGDNPPDAVSRMQNDSVPARLAEARGRYGAPLLKAIEWALAVKAELRPQSVAEWRAAIEAQEAVAAPVTATAQPAAAATASARSIAAAQPVSRTLRSAPVQTDHSASWRRIGWIALWVIAAVVAVSWYKRRPQPSVQPQAPVAQTPAPPPQGRVADLATVQRQITPPVEQRPQAVVMPPQEQAQMVQPPPVADARPSREFASQADPRERPSRPGFPVSIPEKARERVAEEFRGADRSGDGYLSPAEVEGRFPAVARDFSRIDRDGDQRISLDEFTDFRRMQFEGRKPLPPR